MKKNSFSELINFIPEQSKDAILSTLSILPSGLRQYLDKHLSIENEQFIADPIFEPMFGYKTDASTFNDLKGNLLHKTIIDVLDNSKEYRFSKNMHPYLHQKKSWETLLNTKNSLVVSSGTGSGKTECFMIPIISDLASQIERDNKTLEGVQALFIYPLNALIHNQKERLSEWTKPYKGKIRYCLYNGLLPQELKSLETKEAPEEVVDRKHLWESPSPLLITNITMLEYMLIRDIDKSIINKSKGKLKYIVLDEAHTYIGSQAAELSLLLKRVMNAFEVEANNVKFIATSATIGSVDAENQLKKFLSSISGVDEDSVTVIFGENDIKKINSDNRDLVLDDLEKIDDNDLLVKQLKNNKFACSLRNFFISEDCKKPKVRSLSDIQEVFNLTKNEVLRWIDLLSAHPNKEEPFLPIRLHLFHKTFPGIWACADPNCSCKDNVDDWNFGKIYLKERCSCDCGAPVFRVVSCASCGHPLLEAKLKEDDKTGVKRLIPSMFDNIDEFSLEDEEGTIVSETESKVYIDNTSTFCYLSKEDAYISTKESKNSIKIGVYENIDDIKCCDTPEIGKHFIPMQGAPFFLSVVIPSLLKHANNDKQDIEFPHNAQKMICFTDSRQGTARVSVKLQQNAERNSFRTILLHTLAAESNKNNLSEKTNKISPETQALILNNPELQKLILNNPELRKQVYIGTTNQTEASNQNVSYDELTRGILNEFDVNDLKWIFKYYREKDSIFNTIQGKRNLLEILFVREFARRPKKAVNMETLGLLATSYDFTKITEVPDSITKYFKNVSKWKDFLKIIIDYYIRAEGYISYPENWFKWGAIRKKTKVLYPPKIEGGKKSNYWPLAKEKGRQHKIINLLAYANKLDMKIDFHRDIVNEIMLKAWEDLTKKTDILTATTDQGYYMKFEKINLSRPSEIFVCPKTNKAIDVTLENLSPYSTSVNTPTCEKYIMPQYDYGIENGKNSDECTALRKEWLETNPEIKRLKEIGIWSNISSSIILGNKYFRTAEHSAQQNSDTLKKYEKEFKEGSINILNCSTTMEMGVDIGGILISTMNNVPPHPANYLQRAGRAGRRKETKAICFTICKSNSHDDYVFENPKWAFETKINAPYVDQYSFIVLQRHINSLLLSCFFDNTSEKVNDATKLNMEWLMLTPDRDNNNLVKFLSFCKNAIRSNKKIQNSIKNIIRNTSYSDLILDRFIEPLEDLIYKMQKKWYNEYDAIQEQKVREKGNKYSLKAIEKHEKRLLKEYVLNELIRYDILPRYSFPVNIVSFDTKNIHNLNDGYTDKRFEDNPFKKRELPTRDIKTALREYAPGSDVVIDGLVYKSAGITLNWHIPASISDKKEIQSIRHIWQCSSCGATGTKTDINDIHCDVCGSAIKNDHIIKYIEPAGFTVDFTAPVCNDVTTQIYIPPCNPLITARGELNNYLGLPYIKYKKDCSGSVIYYSKGGGNGYFLCLECGRMEAYNENNKKNFKHHKRLRSSTNNKYDSIDCNPSSFSVVEKISLGFEDKTDILELFLRDINGYPINDKTLAYTLSVAIRNAIAKYLNVELEELGCNVKEVRNNQGREYCIQLYDVSSSGYCSSDSITNNLNQIFKMAKDILKCNCLTSCSKCLLQNDTKYNYDSLDRKVGLEFLSDEWLNKNELNENMKIFGDNTVISTYSIENAIENFKDVQYVYLIIPRSSENDDLINSPIYRIINRCNLLGIKVYICIDKDKHSNENIEILSHLSKYDNVFIKSIPETINPNMIAIIGDGIKNYGFASFDETVKNIDILWGSNNNTSILSGSINIRSLNFNDIELSVKPNISFDKMYEIKEELNGYGNEFGKKLIKILDKSLNDKIKKSEIIKIIYKDRYMKTPLASGLFFNFIKALKEKYDKQWQCNDVVLETSEIEEETSYPSMFYHNWKNSSSRKDVLEQVFSDIDVNINIIEKDKKYLEHNRIMEIELANGEFLQLIFDQGFSYWRCVSYKYYENMYPFDTNAVIQTSKIINNLPYVTGDSYPTRIFYTLKMSG